MAAARLAQRPVRQRVGALVRRSGQVCPGPPGNAISTIHARLASRLDAIAQHAGKNGKAPISRNLWLRRSARPADHWLADPTCHVYFHTDNPMVN